MAQRRKSDETKPHRERTAPAGDAPPVVGVGASAGGVGAFQTFVGHVPGDAGIAWVLIQHMAPDRESHLAEILARKTSLPVVEVTEETAVEPDHVYVIAPGRTMTLRGGRLRTISDQDPLARRTSIDAFFLSLAADQGEHAGCALLSGAGTDGTIGLKAVKEAGGLTLTQTTGTAEYDSMLLSAVRTGLVDVELPVEEMPRTFAGFLIRRRTEPADGSFGDGDRLHACQLLRKVTGHDFSGYKSSTVDRRLRRRMQMLGIGELSDYLRRLEEDKDETARLFGDLLIGVTQFFRDPESFEALAGTVLLEILASKTADDEVRIWIPGCATGEEAYSLAMMVQECARSLDDVPTIRIFGSDIDENALHAARLGRYSKGIEADVSRERLERFFEREDGTYVVRNQLREICLFAQHNMLRDPPFSRLDLISCRNVLIYMNADLQKRLIPVFHYALRRDGFLFLGPAENASQHPRLFADTDRKHRIFRRVGEIGRLPAFPIAPGDGGQHGRGEVREGAAREQPSAAVSQAVRRILEHYAPAYVVIDQDYDILEASGGTGAYLELPSGRPRINLSAMARSGLAVDVKAAVAKVMSTGRREVRTDLTVGAGETAKRLSLTVEPLPGAPGSDPLYLVVFQELPATREQSAGRRSRSADDEMTRALEMELQTTKERLQTTAEELETSNEELRVSNEELSSVNEELQSSNEELETSKEELQSINEELRTVNNELSARVEELSRANSDLKNLFANTRIAMLFLDRNFRIMNFTPPAKPLFRLRDHDLGRPLDELSARIEDPTMKADVQTVIREGTALEREVQTGGEEAETFLMRILPYRDEQELVRGAVLTFIDITERKQAERHLATMVSELNHRVKNSLAAIQAMVRQTQASSASVEGFAEAVQGRLEAMAAANNLLSEAAWRNARLDRLAAAVLAPFAEAGSDRLTVSGPDIELRRGVTVPMGIILHELATNATKHGAWSVPEGSVALRWAYLQDDGGTLSLTWTERGGAPAREPERPGFGLDFIRQSTAYELRGECRTEFGPEGFRCTFTLPADGFRWVPPDGREG